jgi:pimeloyl-ACP methyl ester carboxylesterase
MSKKALLFSVALSLTGFSAAEAAAPPAAKPTVVLVHGAFADSSSWDGVVADLRPTLCGPRPATPPPCAR